MVNRHPVIRVLRNIAGFALVLLGVVGLVAPVLQGILFIVLGLALIDLPIKHRSHVWLAMRLGSYRWIALKHHRIKRAILRRRRARKARKAELRRLEASGRPQVVDRISGAGKPQNQG